MATGEETTIAIESVRIPDTRQWYGELSGLGHSIKEEGLHQPITVWSDGTIISGLRRLRCHFLLAGAAGGSKFRKIRAVYVDTVEDAAKRLHADNQDTTHALTMKQSELCSLWNLLRHLDRPAAVVRAQLARRRGIELRRATLRGERRPGRSSAYSESYVLSVLAPPFGMSESSASRLMAIYRLATDENGDPQRREQARRALDDIDEGRSSLWANYANLLTGSRPAPVSMPKTPEIIEPAPAVQQLVAWNRALPRLEGLVSGLTALGPPNPDLSAEKIAEVHTRMSSIRRDLEKMIKHMKPKEN